MVVREKANQIALPRGGHPASPEKKKVRLAFKIPHGDETLSEWLLSYTPLRAARAFIRARYDSRHSDVSCCDDVTSWERSPCRSINIMPPQGRAMRGEASPPAASPPQAAAPPWHSVPWRLPRGGEGWGDLVHAWAPAANAYLALGARHCSVCRRERGCLPCARLTIFSFSFGVRGHPRLPGPRLRRYPRWPCSRRSGASALQEAAGVARGGGWAG